MKNALQILFVMSLMIVLIISCKKADTNSISDEIVFKSVNKEFVLIRDVQTLQASNDIISNHVDSIISGLITEEFISSGLKSFDLNYDGRADLNFEIMNLNPYNQNNLPESFDSLAARVQPITLQVLDNSTYGYPDALRLNDKISNEGNWSSQVSVLGTFMNAGQFQGKGEKYLGFRFNENNAINYGWVKIYCSQHNDTLRVIEYGYNNSNGSSINAGQKE